MSDEVFRAISALNVDYAFAIDEDQLERWPDFFIERCLYRVVPRRDYELGRPASLLQCDTKGMLLDRVSAIRRVNVFEPHRYRHVIGPTKILKAEAAHVETYTSYLVVRTTQNGPMDLFSAGSYRDEVVFEAGAPKFKTRCVVCDSEAVDTLLSLPL
jgi:anthranilate 1,2-dioxygenase small subunit